MELLPSHGRNGEKRWKRRRNASKCWPTTRFRWNYKVLRKAQWKDVAMLSERRITQTCRNVHGRALVRGMLMVVASSGSMDKSPSPSFSSRNLTSAPAWLLWRRSFLSNSWRVPRLSRERSDSLYLVAGWQSNPPRWPVLSLSLFFFPSPPLQMDLDSIPQDWSAATSWTRRRKRRRQWKW